MMQTELAQRDTAGLPRLVKSYQDICQATWGGGFDLDNYVARDLMKALTTTTPQSNTTISSTNPGPGGLSAIELQNLDNTMTSVLFEEAHLEMFNFIAKVPSSTIYYEWNRRNRYGSARRNAGFAEGSAPQGGSVSFTRNGAYIRFMGTKRGVTHPMLITGQMAGTQVDPYEEENRDGTLELLENIERSMIFGDTNIGDMSNNTVNYDGFLASMIKNYPQNVIDMGGAPMSFDAMEDLGFYYYQTAKLRDFKKLRLFMTGSVLGDMSKLKFNADRRMLQGEEYAEVRTGTPLNGHQSNWGFLPYATSIFMEDVEGGLPLSTPDNVVGGTVPAAYANGAVSAAVAAAPGTVTSALVPGTYYYAVAGINDYGENVPVVQTATATITTGGQAVTLTGAAADSSVTFYRVYRGQLASGADLQWVGKIAAGSAAGLIYNGGTLSVVGGAFKYVDYGFWNPTAKGLLIAFDNDPRNTCIAQMSPLLRWPLPINKTQIEWLLILYHTLVIKASERVRIYKNIGPLT